ncbi:MAG: GMC family oxidoreductase N-terminal domain-containing protein [Deltaproteobacteria bacterium]
MFDVAIVGAGSAGCVLAHRLSAESSRKVALIEAGPPKHGSLLVRAPLLYQKLWYGKLCWGYRTVPQAHADQREMYWPRGKVIGGSNSFNAMVYIRGHRDNYDEWRDLGNPGWGYADVLPYFKRSEDNERGASDFHGAGGPMPIRDTFDPLPVSRAFVEAAAARCGVPITTDFNGDAQEGAGFPQVTIFGGVRVSSATHYLDPIRARDNLTVIPNALACSLVLDGDRCTGVKLRVGKTEQVIEAREVIVCGGAIGSPHLLMLSGIGAGAELQAAGVEPRHELRGVGKHLEDHLLVYPQWRTKRGANKALSRLGIVGSLFQHVFAKRGNLTRGPVEALAFVKHSADSPRPDNQFHFAAWGLTGPNSDVKRTDPFGRFCAIMPGLIYPRSQGQITLRDGDPASPPLIDPAYFSDPRDLDHMLAGVKLAREIAATEPLASLLEDEVFPGPTTTSDDDLRAWIRSSANTIFHPTGTCKMGTDPAAVVDPELRVHGLRNLRVADASVMPRIIGGNTNAPTIMIAERCADFMN